MDWHVLKEILEVLSYLAIIIGVPLALAEYRQAQFSAKSEREQALREYQYQNYHFLDEKYLEFLKLCFDNPDLDIFDIPDNKIRTENISSENKKKELIAFSILFSVMERAFLMFYESSDEMKQRQWSGWDAYIHAFARRRNFRDAWASSDISFDEKFQKYVKRIISKIDQ